MRHLLATLTFVLMLSCADAQTISSSDQTKCQVQVAYAISEGDVLGEYSITELVPLEPGQSVQFTNMEFTHRRLYSRVDFDEMFIIRFQPTGVTHFLDATIHNGYEKILNGGCSLRQQPSFSRDGTFFIDASLN
ncbi:MAG: hypothetical protein RLP15_08500 [Cryomorphaceae bacterium]